MLVVNLTTLCSDRVVIRLATGALQAFDGTNGKQMQSHHGQEVNKRSRIDNLAIIISIMLHREGSV